MKEKEERKRRREAWALMVMTVHDSGRGRVKQRREYRTTMKDQEERWETEGEDDVTRSDFRLFRRAVFVVGVLLAARGQQGVRKLRIGPCESLDDALQATHLPGQILERSSGSERAGLGTNGDGAGGERPIDQDGHTH